MTIEKRSEKEGKLGGMLPNSSHWGKRGAQNGTKEM
jgi:hypothetical protein